MTKEQFFKFAEEFFQECINISKKKNSDYTGGDPNPFSNFQSVEVLEISTETGFLTRMMDKMKRIASFVKQGTLQVNDESVTDTLRDLANYSCLLAAYIKSKPKPYVHPFMEEKAKSIFNEPGLKFDRPKSYLAGKDLKVEHEGPNLSEQSKIMKEAGENLFKTMAEYVLPHFNGPKSTGNVDELRKYPFAPDECQESPAVSLQNTKSFLPIVHHKENSAQSGVYDGKRAVKMPDGLIWPYKSTDDFGAGPGKPIKP